MDLYHIQKWFTPFSREALEEHRSGSLLMTTINKENRIFEKESNRVHKVPSPFCNGYGDVDRNCRKRNKRSKDGFNDISIPIRGFMDNIKVTTKADTKASISVGR